MSHPTLGVTNRKNSENMVIGALLVLLGFRLCCLICFPYYLDLLLNGCIKIGISVIGAKQFV